MSAASPGDSDPLVGRVLEGRYAVDARIGRGGMGSVYRGRHLLMDRPVALKLLRPDLAADPTATKRFTREAKSTFRLDHPNCVRVTDFGATEDGVLYIVMELLDGRTVGDELYVDGPMAPARVAHVCRQVCEALDCAHALGYVHRDLKPENVMLLRRGDDPDFVKVLDFGLAKIVGPGGPGATAMSLSPLTQQGTVFGTPEYMSPEQAQDGEVDSRSDLYSLGVVAYEMLTGQLPFQAATFMAMLSKHVREIPVAPGVRRPELGIPPGFDEIVLACLAKEPDARPRAARVLAARFAELERVAATPAGRVPAAVAASATVDLEASAVHAAVDDRNRRAAAAGAPARGGRRRWSWSLVGTVVALAAAIALALGAALSGGGDGERPGTRAASAAAPDAAAPGESSAGGAAPAPATESPVDAAARPALDAAPTPRADDRERDRSADDAAAERRRQRRRRVAAHLEAARAAQRAGNTLRQLAEADAARKLSPGNATAAYLLGDALVKSGDKVNGCTHLSRARRLTSARRAAERAGCD